MKRELGERFEAVAARRARGMDEPVVPLQWTRGSRRDYAALARFHYRSGRPATATQVWVVRDRRRSIVWRHRRTSAARVEAISNPDSAASSRPLAASRSSTGGPGERGGSGESGESGESGGSRGSDESPSAGRPVAVLVLSLPSLSCALRDSALGDRYKSLPDRASRAAALNREIRCISRVVVHPSYRGLGLAVELVRQALREAPTPLVEAIAAMGRVHPFFERAGMLRYERPALEADARLREALQWTGITAADLAGLDRTLARIERLPRARRVWLRGEIDRWARRCGGGRVGTRPGGRGASGVGAAEARSLDGDATDGLRAALASARLRIFHPPMYFLFDRREAQEAARTDPRRGRHAETR